MNKKHISIFVKKNTLLLSLNFVMATYIVLHTLKHQNFFMGIAINLLIFIVPGFSIVYHFNKKKYSSITIMFLTLLFSTLSSITCIGFHLICHIQPNPITFVLWIFFVSNISLLSTKEPSFEQTITLCRKDCVTLCILVCLVYVSYYYIATYQISYLFDSDIERSGTSYGLLHTGKPYLLTDRDSSFFYAHPPLMNTYSATTILLSGNLPETKHYYDSAMERLFWISHKFYPDEEVLLNDPSGYKILAKIKTVTQGNLIFENILPSKIISIDGIGRTKCFPVFENTMQQETLRKYKINDLLNNMEKNYAKNPLFFAGRLPLSFLSFLSCILLFTIIIKTSHSSLLATIGSLLYFSFPEIAIFGSSGIYTTLINVSMLFLVYFYIFHKEKMWLLFLAGVLCGLTSQKTIILPLSITIWEFITTKDLYKNIKQIVFNKAILGFIFGLMIFWFYGISTEPKTFFIEHFKHHIFDRIFHINTLGYSGYPTITKLWYDFGKNLGFWFFMVSILAINIQFFRKFLKEKSTLGIFFIWFTLGALCYSLVDWRVHYHLLIIVPAMTIGTMIFVSSVRNSVKVFVICICILNIFYNVFITYRVISPENLFYMYEFLGL